MSSDFFHTFQPETRHWTQLLSQKSNWASASFSLIFLSGFVEAFALFHVPHAAYSHRAISPTQLASGGCVPAQLPARVELYWLKDERQGKHSSLVSCASLQLMPSEHHLKHRPTAVPQHMHHIAGQSLHSDCYEKICAWSFSGNSLALY